MNFALFYLINRAVYRVLDFFHHWYVDGSRVLAHKFVSILEEVDKSVAIRLTLKYFFQPLYKDYTMVGRILGVVFRSGRILIGGIFYLFLGAVFLAIYLVWVLIPPVILLLALVNFNSQSS